MNADAEPYPSSIAVAVTDIPPPRSSIARKSRNRRFHERNVELNSASKRRASVRDDMPSSAAHSSAVCQTLI
jgi:hypothetical protein